MLGRPGPHLRIADGHRADALRRVHVSFQQQRRRFERRRDVVEPELRAVGRQQVGHVNIHCQQVADRVGVFRAIQTMDDVAARRAPAFPGAIERPGEPRRKARVLGFGRVEATLEAASPARSVCVALAPMSPHGLSSRRSSRFEPYRTVRRKGRAFVVARDAVFIHEGAVLGRIGALAAACSATGRQLRRRFVGLNSLRQARSLSAKTAPPSLSFLAILRISRAPSPPPGVSFL